MFYIGQEVVVESRFHPSGCMRGRIMSPNSYRGYLIDFNEMKEYFERGGVSLHDGSILSIFASGLPDAFIGEHRFRFYSGNKIRGIG